MQGLSVMASVSTTQSQGKPLKIRRQELSNFARDYYAMYIVTFLLLQCF
jgi:hypothetical protein